MGRRGPPKKPTALKVLEGTYRKDRAPKNEVMPDVAVPDCPDWLPAEAKREWGRIVPHLERHGLISHMDRAALAAYCEAYATWRAASEALQEHGMTQTTETGYIAPRPEVGIRNNAWRTMKQYLALFGLSPADRASLDMPEPKQDDNPFVKLA